MQPAIFLDRDNTLIANSGDLGDPDQVRLLSGVARGLRALREAGFRLVVVTNQGGVARGKYTEDAVDAVNQRIAALVDEVAEAQGVIDRFYYCPYHPEATIEEYRRDHPWRKPHPGMILQAARDLQLDLRQSWLIGDQKRDIQAGRSAGCRTILVTNGSPPSESAQPTAAAPSFEEAVTFILRAGQSRHSGDQGHSSSATAEPMPRQTRSNDGAPSGRVEPAPEPAPRPRRGRERSDESDQALRSVTELVEELRLERLHRVDFTPMKLAAGIVQLLSLLLVLLALLQISQTETFFKWMSGALVAQLAAITLLLAESRR